MCLYLVTVFFIVFFWGVVFYFLDLGVLSLHWVLAPFFFKKELRVQWLGRGEDLEGLREGE